MWLFFFQPRTHGSFPVGSLGAPRTRVFCKIRPRPTPVLRVDRLPCASRRTRFPPPPPLAPPARIRAAPPGAGCRAPPWRPRRDPPGASTARRRTRRTTRRSATRRGASAPRTWAPRSAPRRPRVPVRARLGVVPVLGRVRRGRRGYRRRRLRRVPRRRLGPRRPAPPDARDPAPRPRHRRLALPPRRVRRPRPRAPRREQAREETQVRIGRPRARRARAPRRRRRPRARERRPARRERPGTRSHGRRRTRRILPPRAARSEPRRRSAPRRRPRPRTRTPAGSRLGAAMGAAIARLALRPEPVGPAEAREDAGDLADALVAYLEAGPDAADEFGAAFRDAAEKAFVRETTKNAAAARVGIKRRAAAAKGGERGPDPDSPSEKEKNPAAIEDAIGGFPGEPSSPSSSSASESPGRGGGARGGGESLVEGGGRGGFARDERPGRSWCFRGIRRVVGLRLVRGFRRAVGDDDDDGRGLRRRLVPTKLRWEPSVAVAGHRPARVVRVAVHGRRRGSFR